MFTRLQQGFTMLELMVTVTMIGIIGVILSNYTDLAQSLYRGNLNLRGEFINERIAEAMNEWAESNNAELPAPVVNAAESIHFGIHDPADNSDAMNTLRNLITQRSIPISEINDDGRISQFVRVYQRVTGLTEQVPFFGLSGDQVTLTYQVGAVYHTPCPRNETGAGQCNENDANNPPSDSPLLTAANYTAWTVIEEDGNPGWVSTLPLQRRLLRVSASRANIIRDQLRAYFNALQTTAPPGSVDNFYPFPASVDMAASATGVPAENNQGCLDGWYNLQTTDVLDQIGLGREEFGVTAFGGVVEYCRDFSPLSIGTGDEGTLPHNAAIRILRDVSSGNNPSGLAANNVVLSL